MQHQGAVRPVIVSGAKRTAHDIVLCATAQFFPEQGLARPNAPKLQPVGH